jgi:hypothetical protein
MHDGPTAFRFELAGHLSREGACRLDQDWCTASSTLGERRLIVDMTFVTGVDEQARALLSRWHQDGARLIANSATSRALAESILGDVIPEPPKNTLFARTSDQTWLPFHSSFLGRAATLFFLAAIVFPAEAFAARLKSETVIAWNDSVGRPSSRGARSAAMRANVEQVRSVGASSSHRNPPSYQSSLNSAVWHPGCPE